MIVTDLEMVTKGVFDAFSNTAELQNVFLAQENEPARKPPADKPWCRLSHRPGDNTAAEMGTGRSVQLGISFVQVFVPVGTGIAAGYDIAQALDNTMKKWRSDDKHTYVYKTSYNSTPATKENPFFQINYLIYWRSIRP